ncbi:MAG: hypothetical protein J0I06_07100 [Planctomycetes bacterium]|nr:hypothetical protein [Planctomycetota bacterium]
MTHLRRRAAGAALFLVLAALIGCGKSGPKLVPVSGTVTYDGQPLPEGTVYFKTAQTGAMDTLPVKDGKFEGSAEVGERRVEVTAYRTKVQDLNGMKGEIKESLVPARFNANSTLTATVKADGPNTFKFDVTSK